MKRDWEELAFMSHYDAAVAIHEALQAGEVQDTITGLEELIDALSRSEERALVSYLVLLMQHILKWQVQPQRRSPSWVATIRESRKQVRHLQQRHPRFTDARLRAMWADVLDSAINAAERDMNQAISAPPALTWEEVFETPYTLADQPS